MEFICRTLKEYIIEQKKESLKRSLSLIKTQLDFDTTAIDHLHYALYKFQDAVISVLRGVSIKPHWMFALDNLVRNAVHVSLMILSPGLGENLAGQDREDCADDDDEGDELSNSGVSTVNSTKIKHLTGKDSGDKKFLMEQLKSMKLENSKLLNELIESQKSFHSLVKSIPQDHEVFADILRNLTSHMTNFTKNIERSISHGYFSDDQSKKSSNSLDSPEDVPQSNRKNSTPLFKNPQLKSPHGARQMFDPKLTEWLCRHGIDEESRQTIGFADFTYEDLMYESDKDDVRRIGLK